MTKILALGILAISLVTLAPAHAEFIERTFSCRTDITAQLKKLDFTVTNATNSKKNFKITKFKLYVTEQRVPIEWELQGDTLRYEWQGSSFQTGKDIYVIHLPEMMREGTGSSAFKVSDSGEDSDFKTSNWDNYVTVMNSGTDWRCSAKTTN